MFSLTMMPQVRSTCPWGSEAESVKPARKQHHNQQSSCPWESEATSESFKPGRQQLRQHQQRDTCPWGDGGSERSSSKSRRSNSSSRTKNTCPWSDNAPDGDSASLARAEKLRQRPPVGFHGCAGSGAPKPPRAPERDSYPAQPDMLHSFPVDKDSFPAQRDMAHTEPVASDMSGDPDAQERADLIEKCLAHGLTDEQIEGVLREHMFQKMMEKEAEADMIAAHQTSTMAANSIGKSQMTGGDMPLVKPANSSVAAKRQANAQAKKSTSFGPSDEEIAGILEVGRTTSPPMHAYENKPSTMEMKNGKAKEVAKSGFNLGHHSEQDSRAAYLESQRTAAAVKARNRGGTGIF